MSAPGEPDVFDKVAARIEQALAENKGKERLLVFILMTLFLSGIGLIIYGILSGTWWECGIGTLLEGTIYYPFEKLRKIWQYKLLYRTFSEFLRLADKTRTQALLTQFLARLIERIE